MIQEKTLPLMLVVDDEPGNVVLLQRLFQRHFQVMTANNGQDALDILVQAPFDVVLLDIMMPGMDGLEALGIIRSRPNLADIPVILVSALTDNEDIVRGLQLGANDYIAKPIEADIVQARVQTQLQLKRLTDERKHIIQELQAAQEMKDRFLRIASHDLKAPLTNFGLAQYLLKEIVGENAKAAQLFEMIDSTLLNMRNVIEELLDTAAMQNGALELNIQRVPLQPLIIQVVQQQELHAVKKSIRLDVLDTDGVVRADAARLAQVLGNFVSNAIKYSPPNSTVTIWADADPSTVRVCIADQGPGIPRQAAKAAPDSAYGLPNS
jgi:signal transduction histidine kinase